MAIKTILVPTDFSKTAANALNYAVKVAEKTKSKIILLHAYQIDLYSPDLPVEYFNQINSLTKGNSEKQLVSLISKVKRSSKIIIDHISIEYPTVGCILETIVKKKIDLVIMGTKGASGIKEIFLGSVAGEVIEKAKCPVLAIPLKASYTGLKRITYASDYHSSDITILKKLVEIAKIFKSKINVLHIAVAEFTMDSEKDILKTFINKVDRKVEYNNLTFQILYGKDEEKEIEKYLKSKTTDLLSISTRKRTLLEKFLSKSITKTLSYHTIIPLLAFHYKKSSVVFI
ncbi:MAG: universal stress protein [Bacteroidetes bacterium]|nr:universal stress protein [Bacteroidota bacterium]